MSKYAVYEIFGDSAPYNVEFCGHLVGARVGTSDKNPLDINGTTCHTSEHVCCKDCAHMSKNPLVGCGWICSYFGFPLPDRDGFCAWGEPKDEGDK